MNHFRNAFVALAGLGALGVALGFAAQQTGPATAVSTIVQTTPALAAENYEVDSVHSSVVFRIEHLGVSSFYGTFNEINGSYTYDTNSPGNSTFEFVVKTDSVDSRSAKRDRHLKSPDFFNVAEYPEITFKSTKVEASGDDTLRVTGDLSLHGVTKSITIDKDLVGRKDTGRMGFKSGFDAVFTVKRSDFGMDTYVAEGALGDEVKLFIGIEGNRK